MVTHSQYTGADINIVTGMGTSPSNPPQGAGGDADNRYCAAWDDVKPAIEALAIAIEMVAAKVNVDVSSYTSKARDLANKSKMPRNRGE